MELKLNKKSFEYMGTVFRSCFTHEVTTESIIPDSLPDAERIIGTEAMVYIRNKEPENGRLTVAGMVDAYVIYADDEGRVRRTQISEQFGTSVDNSGVTVDSKAVVTMRIASADARLLNPRKMLVRCDVLLNVECYEPRRAELFLPPEEGTYPVELLTEEREATVLGDMAEKTFSVTGEYSLPSGKPAVGEILSASVRAELEDDTSAMLKGMVKARLLYRPERGGAPETVEFSTAFSQLMEFGGDCTGFRASIVPTAVYLTTDSLYDSEDRRIVLEVNALAQCLAYRKETVACITDAYSCGYEVETQTGETEIDTACSAVNINGQVREIIETSREPRDIVSVSACPGVVYTGGGELKTTVTASVLYMSEDGVLLSASKKLNASAELPESEGAVTAAMIQGEPLAVISAGGIEIKLNVGFRAETSSPVTAAGLTAITVDTDSPKDQTDRPSLVLRRFGEGDTLWTLAKRYSSVSGLIAGRNGFEPGTEPEIGSMLIIPRKR
jgi:hypothetical protein